MPAPAMIQSLSNTLLVINLKSTAHTKSCGDSRPSSQQKRRDDRGSLINNWILGWLASAKKSESKANQYLSVAVK
jgi:hypothetical protein